MIKLVSNFRYNRDRMYKPKQWRTKYKAKKFMKLCKLMKNDYLENFRPSTSYEALFLEVLLHLSDGTPDTKRSNSSKIANDMVWAPQFQQNYHTLKEAFRYRVLVRYMLQAMYKNMAGEGAIDDLIKSELPVLYIRALQDT